MTGSVSSPQSPADHPPVAFSAAVLGRLERADLWCRNKGQRLTETRRQVLGLILSDPKPSGAYDLLSRLRQTQANAAPPTVYRALDFLMELGLIHRIECLSAFVACSHAMECNDACDHHAEQGVHRAQFLICRDCNRVRELEEPQLTQALLNSARQAGFQPDSAAVEIRGVCAVCQRRKSGADSAPG